MALSPGTRLGPYEITAQIGVGGMGEVYRATDANLKRAVAIKVLPEVFASDAERLARFQREAEVLALLNHPNVAGIYGLERTDSTTALVMELVEGPTLADRIAQGPIPVDEALAIAKQIAEALEGAHEQGIIHRDLKPANIKLRENGTVKVLDFGLAKALEPARLMSPSVTRSPTITSPAVITGVGVLLGTAAYMSPEQARGKQADKRSDIWAFGCVLFEMLTGAKTFDGETVAETIASILKDEPAFDALPPEVPSPARRLLRRCLEKDRKHRLRDIGDALHDLSDSLVAETAAAPPRKLPLFWIGPAILGLLAGAGWYWSTRPATDRQPFTLTIVPPAGAELSTSLGASLDISPDGTAVLFSGRGGAYVRQLDALPSRRVPGSEKMSNTPFWSADSSTIVFPSEDRALMKVRLPNGAPEVIAPLRAPSRGGSWSDTGTILVWAGELLSIPAAGTNAPTPIKTPAGACWYPEFLPGSEDFLCFSPSPDGSAGQAYLAEEQARRKSRCSIAQEHVLAPQVRWDPFQAPCCRRMGRDC
jgi:eukaryotic-like serine/threonine-protein kinase